MSNLALLGGKKTRTEAFSSRPHIDARERSYVDRCLNEKLFSRFIGSPVSNFREQLAFTSKEAGARDDFWSVLGGPFVRNFEAAFAARHQVKYAISSNSATSSTKQSQILLCVCSMSHGQPPGPRSRAIVSFRSSIELIVV